MEKKLQELKELTAALSKRNGIQDTDIPALKLIQQTTLERTHTVYTPSLCVIVQGSKDVILGETIYTYSPGECIAISVDLPVTGQITEASVKKPYLCLMLEIDPVIVFDVVKSISQMPKVIPKKKAIYVEKVAEETFDAFIRLLKCLKNPVSIPLLAPMIIREIIFRMLSTKHGDIIKELGIVSGQTQKVRRAIDILKDKYSESIHMENLAREVGMSPASFHKFFKDVTTLSPLQYQKQIRLQEARRLLLLEATDAASISYEVGYESPSQFSREYARLFGLPPKADIKRLKAGA